MGTGGRLPGVNRSRREAKPLVPHVFMVWWLIEHRDFAFYIHFLRISMGSRRLLNCLTNEALTTNSEHNVFL
jgi:hypothetical protein